MLVGVIIIAFVVLMGQSCFAEKGYIQTIPYSEFEQILNEGTNAVVCCSARDGKNIKYSGEPAPGSTFRLNLFSLGLLCLLYRFH